MRNTQSKQSKFEDKIFLLEWRQAARLTQEELGALMGVSGTQISRVEDGLRDWDGRFLRKFKQVINQRLDEIDALTLRVRHTDDLLCVDPHFSALMSLMLTLERHRTPDTIERMWRLVAPLGLT